MSKLTKTQWLGLICLLIYIPAWIRVIHASTPLTPPLPFQAAISVDSHDSVEYATLAGNLLSEHRFTMDTQAPFIPDTFRTPGYPLFLAVVLLIFKSYFAATFLQILMVWFSAIIVCKMGEKLFSPTVGFIAGLCFMLDPTVIFHTMVILSDIPFTLVSLFAVYLLFFGENHTSKKMEGRKLFYIKALCAGIIFGISILIRPIGIYMAVILVIFYWLYLHYGRKSSPHMDNKSVLIACGCLIAGITLVVFPWTLRNKIETGVWGISSITAYNLYEFNVPWFLEWKGVPTSSANGFMLETTGIDDAGARFLSNDPVIMAAAEKEILSDPIHYLEYHIPESTPFLTSSGLAVIDQANTFGFERMLYPMGAIPSQLFTIESVVWVCIFILACLAWYVFREDVRVSFFMILFLYSWFVTGPLAYARYRIPVEGFVIILAVGVIEWLYKRGIS